MKVFVSKHERSTPRSTFANINVFMSANMGAQLAAPHPLSPRRPTGPLYALAALHPLAAPLPEGCVEPPPH